MNIRQDFDILKRSVKGGDLVYLDNAATTQKPNAVIEAIDRYYRTHNANVHRAAHTLADEATRALEAARDTVASFVNARRREEIVWTRGTTEAINLLANCISGALDRPMGPGDEVLITELEHHSNIVPWQLLAERTGATLRAVTVTPDGDLDLEDLDAKLNERTRVFAFGYVSNALGTVNPVEQLVRAAHDVGALAVIDAAQASLHIPIDVQVLDADFLAISGHKMYGPTGIGALWGRYDLLERMPPWHGGGEMIETVSIERSTYQAPPFRFEAGTPHIAGAIGLGAAIEYLRGIPWRELVHQEDALVAATRARLEQIPGLQIVGRPRTRSAVISFNLDAAHPHDVATLLDQQGVAVRSGHHCTMPLMQRLSLPGTVRASFSLYNNEDDADRLIAAVDKATTFL